MARPRKSDHTRQQLIEAGTELITSNGYHGTGIKAVLDQVGVPKGSFYNFFDSKEAFVATIIEHYGLVEAEQMLANIAHLLEQPALVQLWCNFSLKVKTKVEANQSCACLIGAMSAEIAEASDQCRDAIIDVEKQWIETIQAVIEQAQTEGDINTTLDPIRIAPLLYNSWQGCLLQYQVNLQPQLLLEHLWTLLSSWMTEQGHQTFTESEHCSREI
jgi:TetR/AcrR family transcriptional regulator, transcriptional repressor for nem operon